MSRIDAARRMFDAFNDGRYIENPDAIWRDDAEEIFAAIYDPACEIRPTGADSRSYRGHDGVQAYLSDLADAWAAMRLEPTAFTEAGDNVVVEYRNHARGRESGAMIEQTFWMVVTVKDDRVLRQRNYADRDAALRAAAE
jgi:ketosteroid isomerase-like protein